MRKSTEYENYLFRLIKYYKIKNMETPSWIGKAKHYYTKLYYTARDLSEMCTNTAIPKATMEYLANLEIEPLDDFPIEMTEGRANINSVLMDMYKELIDGRDIYFINEWTLSKLGRKKMREYINMLPTVHGIMPPKNEFTNVPDSISFSNRAYGFKAEFALTVTMAGSRICIRNGDGDSRKTEYIDFTEGFLDNIIPLVQWENLKYLLHKKDRSEECDDSIYQDFKTVLVDIDWNEYDLKLSAGNEDNIFIKVLELVWKEYADIFREKGLVLPWFEVLGWSER